MSNRKRLLTAYGGYREIVHSDDNVNGGEDLMIETLQDCEPIIERAKMLSALSPTKNEMFRHVAIMPRIVMDKAMAEGWFNDEKALKRWINDPDNAKFRTWHGTI